MSEISRTPVRPSHRFGVYARCIHEGKLLTVRQEYGPYRGLLGLPGGSPDGTEEPRETLERVIASETGGSLTECGDFQELDFIVTRASDGSPIHFNHTALVADACVESLPDAGRYVWFDLTDDRSLLSELASRSLG